MSDPFLSSSSEPSSSQSSAELSSQSSVQSLFESVFYEVTDSSNSQVSQVSSPSDLSFPLDNHDYILLDLVLPAPAPHTHIQESDLPAILTESRLEVLQQSPSVTPRGLRQGISLLADGTLVSKIGNPDIILFLKQTPDSVSQFGQFCGQCVGTDTATATEEPRLLNSSTFFHLTGE